MYSFDLVIDFKNTLNLNDKLSELVTSLSSIGFENKVTMPNLALFTKDNIHAIMITQQQYSYKINGDFAVENFSEIIEDISSTINSIIEWIEGANYCFRLVSIDDCIDSFTKTKALCSSSSADKSIIGIGYRYFFKKSNRFSEFKAEPYIRNQDKIYFEGIYNFSNFSNSSVLNKILNDIYSDFKDRITIFKKLI